MKRYIDKSIIIAEIEKRIKEISKEFQKSEYVQYTLLGKINALENLLSFIDSIEAKEIDFENSMVCKVGWYDGTLLDYTQEQQDDLLEKIGANVGDKIRVILIKE